MPDEFWAGATFREIVTSLIALAIVMVSLCMLGRTFKLAGEFLAPEGSAVTQDSAVVALQIGEHERAYARQKDVLLLALSLLGTVTGYYLGRVPAELRAQQGNQAMKLADARTGEAIRAGAETTKSANELAVHAQRRADGALATLIKVRATLSPSEPISRVASPQSSPEEEAIRRALRILDDHLELP